MYKSITSNIEKVSQEIADKETNLEAHMQKGLSILTQLSYYYNHAPIHLKQKIIGSIFPEKLIFNGNKYRTTKVNSFIH